MFRLLIQKFLLMAVYATVLATSVSARAQEHEDDILIHYDNEQIAFANPGTSYLDANYVYKGAFATSGFLNRFTSDPGFESWPTFLNPGDQLGLTTSASRFGTFLTAFDPISGSILNDHDYSIRINTPVDSPLELTAQQGGSRLLGTASSNGYFHFHPEFRLSENAPIGAYGMLLSLDTSAAGIADSEKFWLVLNYGMSKSDFDSAVLQFTGIPEPSSIGILFACGALVMLRRRRTTSV